MQIAAGDEDKLLFRLIKKQIHSPVGREGIVYRTIQNNSVIINVTNMNTKDFNYCPHACARKDPNSSKLHYCNQKSRLKFPTVVESSELLSTSKEYAALSPLTSTLNQR